MPATLAHVRNLFDDALATYASRLRRPRLSVIDADDYLEAIFGPNRDLIDLTTFYADITWCRVPVREVHIDVTGLHPAVVLERTLPLVSDYVRRSLVAAQRVSGRAKLEDATAAVGKFAAAARCEGSLGQPPANVHELIPLHAMMIARIAVIYGIRSGAGAFGTTIANILARLDAYLPPTDDAAERVTAAVGHGVIELCAARPQPTPEAMTAFLERRLEQLPGRIE